MTTDRQVSSPTIPVRLTRTPGSATRDLAAELRGATGLTYHPDVCRWFATQTELDTPHATFRIDAR